MDEFDFLVDKFNKSSIEVKTEREEDKLDSCEVCLKKIKQSEMPAHQERCYAAFLSEDWDDPVPVQPPKSQPNPAAKLSKREKYRKVLLKCGYTDEEIMDALDEMEKIDKLQSAPTTSSVEKRILTDKDEIVLAMVTEECGCPVCGRKVPLVEINRHLDRCLAV